MIADTERETAGGGRKKAMSVTAESLLKGRSPADPTRSSDRTKPNPVRECSSIVGMWLRLFPTSAMT